MPFRNASAAVIRESKTRGYVLNEGHTKNGGKARFFAALGFTPDNWQDFEAALREQHLTQDAFEAGVNAVGRKWIIEAELKGPKGSARIRSVWFVPFDGDTPSFVTAYPDR